MNDPLHSYSRVPCLFWLVDVNIPAYWDVDVGTFQRLFWWHIHDFLGQSTEPFSLEQLHMNIIWLINGYCLSIWFKFFLTLWFKLLCIHKWCFLCTIWYHLYNFEKVKNSHGGVILLVRLQALTCNFTKSVTPPWVLLLFFKLYKWYQTTQSVSHSIYYFVLISRM